MTKIKFEIRKAKSGESKKMTKIAYLSKASRGYSKEWLSLWQKELTVSEYMIEKWVSYVAEVNNEIIGFWSREPIQSNTPSHGLLFIHPDYQNQGVGHALWYYINRDLKKRGVNYFTLEADPNAISFYQKIGGKKIGDKSSPVIPGRKLPVIKFILK